MPAVRMIHQAEAAECGLASLAMVSASHGGLACMRELRRRFPPSLNGITLKGLIATAQRLGFDCRPMKLPLEGLPALRTPCILHWDLNHFVVLAKATARGVTILDPAIGKRRMTLAAASDHFTGVALELTPTTSFQPAITAKAVSISQLTGRIRGLGRSLSLILLLSLALQCFVLLSPFFLQWVIDQVLVPADRGLLMVLGVAFTALLLLQVGAGFLRGWSVVHLAGALGIQWALNVFGHLLHLPLDFFEKRHLGDVTSRLGSLQSIQRTLTTSFVESIIDGAMALATFVMMCVYSGTLAALSALAVALYVALRAGAFLALKQGTERQLVAEARQQTHLLESIRGIQSLKIAGGEGFRRATHANLLNEAVNRQIIVSRWALGFESSSDLIFGLERVVVIWVGATLALDNMFSVGMLVAYLAWKELFATRVRGLIDKGFEFRMLRLHGERLADIVLAEPEYDAASDVIDIASTPATIELRNVGFRYAEHAPWIVRNCSFSVAAGESVAIRGASGSGKTTLMKIMLGLLRPDEGEVLIGGKPVTQIGLAQYRACLGVVMQDDQLFAGSLEDNIAFGDQAPDPARVERAAAMAAIHDDIMAMPMAYRSLVGDMGSTLSGGQKQRVLLARALYREPRFLFLDEATSHLDVDREHSINATVRYLRLTRIIVAHRPDTIESADRVLVLSQGRLVAG